MKGEDIVFTLVSLLIVATTLAFGMKIQKDFRMPSDEYKLIKECEKELPRNLRCIIEKKAVVDQQKGKRDE